MLRQRVPTSRVSSLTYQVEAMTLVIASSS